MFGQVLVSTDSGQSWFEIYGGVRQGYRDFSNVNFPAVSISDDENWLVVGSHGIIAGADNYIAGEAILKNGEEHRQTFRSIKFTDDNNAIAAGFRIAQKYLNAQGDIEELAIGLYYTTDDGGQTWIPFEGPDNIGYRWHSVDQDNNDRLYLAGLDFTDGININGIIKISDDNGFTWETAGNTNQEVGAMIIWDEDHGYATTFGNQFLFINEEGEWEASVMPPPVSSDNPLNSIDVLGPGIVFVGGGTIFMGGSPYIFRTLDGGQDWDQVFTHSSAGRISGIHFMDGEFALAGGVWGPIGNRQNILVTEDYGNTWQPVNVNFVGVSSAEMARFNIARKDHIIAYGANGHVVQSFDAENIEFFGLDFRFSDVSFHGDFHLNPNQGWLVAEQGAIFKYDKTDPVKSVPARFSNLFPEMGEEVEITVEGVEFSWTPSYDHDGGSISYELVLETLEGEPKVYKFNTTETSFIIDLYSAGDMQDGLYQWRVIATDSEGLPATTYPHDVEIIIGELPNTFTVTFEVKDEEEEPITDAVITFDNVTNEPGDYVFEDIPEGTYDYKVEKEGYLTVEDQVAVEEDLTVDVILIQETFTVSFNVADEDNNDITDAVITFGNVTNDPGDYVFEDIPAGTYDYKVEKEGYLTVEDQVAVEEDVTVDVILIQETFTVSFNVADEDNNDITDAVITFGNVTNDPGDYVFEDIPEGTYNYKVEKEGYLTVEDQVAVEEDVTMNVTMDTDDLFIKDPSVYALIIFPNPARTVLNIQSNELIHKIKLVDVPGQVVYNAAVNDSFHKINVSNLQAGIYFIHATTSGGVVTHRVHITR